MRKITALAAAAVLACTLTACGTDDPGPTRSVTYRVTGEWTGYATLCAQCPPGKQGAAIVRFIDSSGVEQIDSEGWWYPTEHTVTMQPGATASIKATSTYGDGWVECTILVDNKTVDQQADYGTNRHAQVMPSASCSATV